ncbi:MAG TPA: prephenate dehydratase [Gammaproteobacteria bacterium]|nr:prephenate dehydratase [Gammaproteobacteria bacterium]
MKEQERLAVLRERIDELDLQIQNLICERARCAQGIARFKQSEQGDGQDSFYRPEREAQVLRRLRERNPGPLSDDEMVRLFREIMSACLALEQPLRVAYLGPEGTFTQAAALKHFGHSVATVAQQTIDEVFRDVEAGASHYGVVPVENSTEGVVTHTLDMFLNSPLKIVGEVQLRIHHSLLSKAAGLAAVKRVYSHQQSLAQCREWLNSHLANVERVPVNSNGEAARRAAEEENAAAIAGEQAAGLYGLQVLAPNIEDEPENTTRFLVIGRENVPPSGDDKTALLLAAPNRPGALYELLAPLAKHGISMTRIESRPSRRGVWEYVFFVDLLGHQIDPVVARALQQLREDSAMLRVLGSFPRSSL